MNNVCTDILLLLDGCEITYGTGAVDLGGMGRGTRGVPAPELSGFNSGFVDDVGWGGFYWDGVAGFFSPAIERGAQFGQDCGW